MRTKKRVKPVAVTKSKALHLATVFCCKVYGCRVGLLLPTGSEPLQKQEDGRKDEEEEEEDEGLREAAEKYRLLICGQSILRPQGLRLLIK